MNLSLVPAFTQAVRGVLFHCLQFLVGGFGDDFFGDEADVQFCAGGWVVFVLLEHGLQPRTDCLLRTEHRRDNSLPSFNGFFSGHSRCFKSIVLKLISPSRGDGGINPFLFSSAKVRIYFDLCKSVTHFHKNSIFILNNRA